MSGVAACGGRCRHIVVVGAGLTGLTAAQALSERGYEVTVVEKSRGAGGRMATRRADAWRFDHGAQYFTVRDDAFRAAVAQWKRSGIVREWTPRLAVVEAGTITAKTGNDTRRFVGVPGMNAVAGHLAGKAGRCRFGFEVNAVEEDGRGGWRVRSLDEALAADAVVMTAPPSQTQRLLARGGCSTRELERIGHVAMLPCLAVMVVCQRPVLEAFDAAFVNEGPLSWVASQRSKPERPAAEAWVLHAGPAWSQAHLEAAPEEVVDALLAAAWALPGARPGRALYARAHRWRHALAESALSDGAVSMAAGSLVVAGDWCAGSRVEGAYLSGLAAARRVEEALAPGR